MASRKTSGLLMRFLKSYYYPGCYVILDSGINVLRIFVMLKDNTISGCVLTKKHQYWSWIDLGGEINNYVTCKQIDETNTVS